MRSGRGTAARRRRHPAQHRHGCRRASEDSDADLGRRSEGILSCGSQRLRLAPGGVVLCPTRRLRAQTDLEPRVLVLGADDAPTRGAPRGGPALGDDLLRRVHRRQRLGARLDGDEARPADALARAVALREGLVDALGARVVELDVLAQQQLAEVVPRERGDRAALAPGLVVLDRDLVPLHEPVRLEDDLVARRVREDLADRFHRRVVVERDESPRDAALGRVLGVHARELGRLGRADADERIADAQRALLRRVALELRHEDEPATIVRAVRHLGQLEPERRACVEEQQQTLVFLGGEPRGLLPSSSACTTWMPNFGSRDSKPYVPSLTSYVSSRSLWPMMSRSSGAGPR
mmetsp:Transcript_15530/g.62528  ORF Transcript_15530/g.62528 Transcript_15530/m.62528 type:complete len:350 (+) Transcript_15530:173-1222(+)